ncbi:AraC family transcriptional regulator [Jannaschia sp. W003]|uniref:AraC family transcriptional regulator n=1 Tax=Jannaschia sp. W003 TaxID=2867012 RepID=UPI0021A798E2|nr:AraC family transcriptional regulator [Jannaschia sp. W003]UWQ20080.1 AraC family transcriptional regulator [Jannaschia sp. W003]
MTSVYVHKVVAAVGGAAGPAYLRSVGLDPKAPADVGTMIDADAYYGLLERIAHDLPDAADLPLRVGATMRCDDYGAFGLAWKTAPTLRDSFRRAQRYWRVLTSVAEIEIRPEGAGVWFLLHRAGARRLGLRLSNEATLASALTIMREVAPGSVQPTEVHLRHASPCPSRGYAIWYGCPVTWGSDRDGLLLTAELIDRPNRLGDAGLSAYLDAQLDRALARIRSGGDDLASAVRRTIERSLSDGVPVLAKVAAAMGRSERSLQRALAAEGLSFRNLVDGVRRDLAEGLLVNSDYALTEIAFLAGFSEQSALSRAFRRWNGVTPATFRAARRA